jgi:hypothetical protein
MFLEPFGLVFMVGVVWRKEYISRQPRSKMEREFAGRLSPRDLEIYIYFCLQEFILLTFHNFQSVRDSLQMTSEGNLSFPRVPPGSP